MSKSEKAILNETLVAVSALPETLIIRNNTGMAWQGRRLNLRPGETVRVTADMVILTNARPIHFGVEGSADGIGVSQGRGLAVETKTATGRQQDNQRNFERAWVKAGGLYILARSPDEAVAEIRKALKQ